MNLKLFKNKNLSLLLFGQFVSLIGSGMQSFAFSLYVLKLTGSGSRFASVLALGMIPRLFLGPVCGVFADWFDRKKIIVYLDLLSGVLIGGLYVISIFSTLTMIHVYVTVILLSVISSLFGPAIGTAIPSVIEKEELIEANSLNTFLMSIGNLIYPILAGIVFGVYGISVVLLVNSISFVLSAISEMFIDLPSNNKKTSDYSFKSFKEDFKAGISFIMNRKLLKKLLLCALIVNIVLNPTFSVGIIFVAKILIKVTDIQLGVMQTMMIIGSILGTMLAGPIGKRLSLTKIFHLSLTIIGVLIGLIALNSTSKFLSFFSDITIPYITYITICLVIATIATITNVALFTLIQKETPNELLGRVNSVIGTITMCAIPVGQMVFGFMFDKVSSFIPLVISSITIILTGTVFNFSIKKENLKQKILEGQSKIMIE